MVLSLKWAPFPKRRRRSMVARLLSVAAMAAVAVACAGASARADESWSGLFQRAYAVVWNVYREAALAEASVSKPADPVIARADESWSGLCRRAYAVVLNVYREAALAEASVPKPAEPRDPAMRRLISEASARFDVPELWIRAVMRVESDGEVGATSPKGAMGLMQVMPHTYAYLSDRYNLGDDPYAARNNVLAGSAYLREMYDRFGPAGFLAAYNAGPARYQDYLCGRELPDETKRYVASVRLALGEVLFGQPNSRFYEPISISPKGELLLSRTGKPVPADDRLALHSLVARAVRRAASK
jgi:soluble lytic murein transglycosylase-like protein